MTDKHASIIPLSISNWCSLQPRVSCMTVWYRISYSDENWQMSLKNILIWNKAYQMPFRCVIMNLPKSIVWYQEENIGQCCVKYQNVSKLFFCTCLCTIEKVSSWLMKWKSLYLKNSSITTKLHAWESVKSEWSILIGYILLWQNQLSQSCVIWSANTLWLWQKQI